MQGPPIAPPATTGGAPGRVSAPANFRPNWVQYGHSQRKKRQRYDQATLDKFRKDLLGLVHQPPFYIDEEEEEDELSAPTFFVFVYDPEVLLYLQGYPAEVLGTDNTNQDLWADLKDACQEGALFVRALGEAFPRQILDSGEALEVSEGTVCGLDAPEPPPAKPGLLSRLLGKQSQDMLANAVGQKLFDHREDYTKAFQDQAQLLIDSGKLEKEQRRLSLYQKPKPAPASLKPGKPDPAPKPRAAAKPMPPLPDNTPKEEWEISTPMVAAPSPAEEAAPPRQETPPKQETPPIPEALTQPPMKDLARAARDAIAQLSPRIDDLVTTGNAMAQDDPGRVRSAAAMLLCAEDPQAYSQLLAHLAQGTPLPPEHPYPTHLEQIPMAALQPQKAQDIAQALAKGNAACARLLEGAANPETDFLQTALACRLLSAGLAHKQTGWLRAAAGQGLDVHQLDMAQGYGELANRYLTGLASQKALLEASLHKQAMTPDRKLELMTAIHTGYLARKLLVSTPAADATPEAREAFLAKKEAAIADIGTCRRLGSDAHDTRQRLLNSPQLQSLAQERLSTLASIYQDQGQIIALTRQLRSNPDSQGGGIHHTLEAHAAPQRTDHP